MAAMSDEPTLVTAEHFEYIAAHTRRDDPFLASLKEQATAAGFPPIWINEAQAGAMQILLRLAGAREVVEVGTLAGYSAIALARALPPGGRLRTIEIDPAHAAFARRWAARSDVAERIEVIEGAGSAVLPRLADASVDAVFLDADKDGYPEYLRQALRILRSGGLLMADNAFAFGELFAERPQDPEVGAIRTFNRLMRDQPRLHSVIIPLGDGFWVGVKEG